MEPVTIQAIDGFPLAATWTLPDGDPRAVVIVNSAAAVPRGYYSSFAEFLAAAGFAVLAYDYRGIGESLPAKSLRGFPATMGDWARKDFAGVLVAADGRFPGLPRFVVGHSFGGQAVGFTPQAADVAGVVMVASQSGYWGHWPGLLKLWILPMWYMVIPALCHVWGYLPEWVGVGKGMPKGVALEWAKWGRHRHYAFGYLPEAKEQAAAFRAPILSFSIDGDTYAPRKSVAALLTYFSAADTEHRHLVPREVGFARIGHFGFFRKSHQALWKPVAEWLAHRLQDGKR